MHNLDKKKKEKSVCILWDEYNPRRTCFKGWERIAREWYSHRILKCLFQSHSTGSFASFRGEKTNYCKINT